MIKNSKLILNDKYKWHSFTNDNLTLHYKGYLIDTNVSTLFKQLKSIISKHNFSVSDLKIFIKSIRGHFAFILYSDDILISVVDRVRSIPIFYTNKDTIVVGNHAPIIANSLNSEKDKYSEKAALEIAMSGYTLNNKTLHNNISQLCAGELLVVVRNVVRIEKYYTYSPWSVNNNNKVKLKKELTEISRELMSSVVKNSDGRELVVPLSAGNDSRFIASGLKEVGAKNVHCFSYGISNNFEVKTAREVANQLGYRWSYIPLSISKQKEYFKGGLFNNFLKYTDTLSNSPVLIDYSAVKLLHESKKISRDAIFINGNSGDFITGGHIVNDRDMDINRLVEHIIVKHFGLWECLKDTSNINKISMELKAIIADLMNTHNLTKSNLSDIGESIEWFGRQSKFVTTTQRSYEFYGYDWMLPMWDSIYMDFWERTESKYKIKQSLYIETLLENNWGGVWNNIRVNNYDIASNKVKFVRNFMKLFFIFMKKNSWESFDKKFFSYFYDNTAATAIVPYSASIMDKCGARNRNSWISKEYLFRKGINIYNL